MKKIWMIVLGTVMASTTFAQKKDFSYKFYGQIRTDLYYNTRANEESVDGLFNLFPKDRLRDADGNDLNGSDNSNFYALYSRLGMDIQGPMLGNAKTSAKVEMDFRGSGSSFSTVRLRQAYFHLDWGTSSLLLGQTWHPLFGDVSPKILNLATGAPFQPFSRAPQLRYRYTTKDFRLTAALLWQSQYTSRGPAGKSHTYLKNSCIPEMYIGADFLTDHFMAGVGMECLSLKPRLEATGDDNSRYKVNERITTLSYEAHAKYTNENWLIAAKSVLGSNLTQASGLGGFGVKSTDARTGKQTYTPIRVSSTWINAVYGKKWKPGIFVGYAKNLGSKDELESEQKVYGTGLNLDQLLTTGAELTYNLPNWKFGLEYTVSTAWYGDLNLKNGKVINTHAVSNNRIVAVAMFLF